MTPEPSSTFRTPITARLAAAALVCVLAGPAGAQTVTPTTADFIDWDLPSFEGAGMCAAAIGAVTLPPTGDPVYYVTNICPGASVANPGRTGPVMVRFVPGTPIQTATATWSAWNLGTPDANTGGMKITANERIAFVRQGREIIRVDMVTNRLTHWNDIPTTVDPASQSDLALVERRAGTTHYTDVYTTHDDPVNAGTLQRLSVQNGSDTANVRRWVVNAGAGAQYLSGVAYFQGRIYFSDAEHISELNPNATTNNLRRWHLAEVGAALGRQISVDTKGIIWALAASGHLVSLNPASDQMASYLIPGNGGVPSPGPLANPLGIGASGGVVGFTESDAKKVGLLNPNATPIPVTPDVETAPFSDAELTGISEVINRDAGFVMPLFTEDQPGTHTDLDPFGDFIEVTTPNTGNFPIGIYRDVERAVGNFYFVQIFNGTTEHRLSHVSFDLSQVSSAGLVTGGGTIHNVASTLPLAEEIIEPDADAWGSTDRANFGFNVYRKVTDGPVRGHLNYLNKETGEHVKSITVATLLIAGNTAEFSGTCVVKRGGIETPCSFTVKVQDNGNPGKGNDVFEIEGIGLTPNGGVLTGGNIKIHQSKQQSSN